VTGREGCQHDRPQYAVNREHACQHWYSVAAGVTLDALVRP
jgi:hypothetical protein